MTIADGCASDAIAVQQVNVLSQERFGIDCPRKVKGWPKWAHIWAAAHLGYHPNVSNA
jgi:hypothetical protein